MKAKLALKEWIFAILAIVALVLILALTTDFFEKLNEKLEYNKCKADVYKAAYSGIGKVKFLQNIKCPTKDTVITEKSQIQIKRRIAKEMLKCWDTFGYGKLDIFEDDGIYCHMCSRINFNKQENVKGLTKYLFTAKAKAGQTYSQVFNPKFADDGKELLNVKDTPDEIDTNKDYATIFVFAKGKASIEKIAKHYGEVYGAGILGTGLVVLGLKLTAIGTIEVFTGVLSIKGALTIIGGVAVLATGTATIAYEALFGGQESDRLSFIQLSEYNTQQLSGIGCENPISTLNN